MTTYHGLEHVIYDFGGILVGRYPVMHLISSQSIVIVVIIVVIVVKIS